MDKPVSEIEFQTPRFSMIIRRVHGYYLSLLNCLTPSMKKTYVMKIKKWQSLSINLSASSTWNCGTNALRIRVHCLLHDY